MCWKLEVGTYDGICLYLVRDQIQSRLGKKKERCSRVGIILKQSTLTPNVTFYGNSKHTTNCIHNLPQYSLITYEHNRHYHPIQYKNISRRCHSSISIPEDLLFSILTTRKARTNKNLTGRCFEKRKVLNYVQSKRRENKKR